MEKADEYLYENNYQLKNAILLKRAEASLDKKKKEYLAAKDQRGKLASEFIELWMKVNQIKRQINSKRN